MRRDDLCHDVRLRLERLPPPHAAHYGVVPAAPPERPLLLGDVVARHSAAMRALAQVDQLASELHDPYVINRLLARREAVSSSSIEGTHSTLDELLSVEEGEDRAHAAVAQVRDYALLLDRVMPDITKRGAAAFDRTLIETLHRGVMQGDPAYRDVPGQLRDRVVWIGGGRFDIAYSTYNPPPPAAVPDALAATLSYMRGEGMQLMTQSIVARMAIAHAHFESVHPFRDGNGRVGRLLLPLMMAAEGHVPLYLSPYIEANKADYYESLRLAQQRLDWQAATAFMADAIVGSHIELMATRSALAALSSRWAARRRFRGGSAAKRALSVLPDYPVLTATRLAERLSVSAPAALNAIDQLSDAAILVERTGYRRNRVYVAPEVLAIVNRPFGALPPDVED